MTCSCLCLNTVCSHSCPHPVCKQWLSAWWVWGITLGTEVTAGRGHSLDCAENGVCVMRLESNSQGSVSGRLCQPWQRFGDLFFKGYRNTLKGWSGDLMWPDLLYWKIILINTTFRRVFISRERVKNTCRRVHSKIHCLFYPLQSVLSTHMFSVLFIFFVQLKYFKKNLKFIQAEYRQWLRGNHTWNRVNSSLFQ